MGFAVYYHTYSTWLAKPGIFLEDLFVHPDQRGKGYGKRLLAEVAKRVEEMGGGRLDWYVRLETVFAPTETVLLGVLVLSNPRVLGML